MLLEADHFSGITSIPLTMYTNMIRQILVCNLYQNFVESGCIVDHRVSSGSSVSMTHPQFVASCATADVAGAVDTDGPVEVRMVVPLCDQ